MIKIPTSVSIRTLCTSANSYPNVRMKPQHSVWWRPELYLYEYILCWYGKFDHLPHYLEKQEGVTHHNYVITKISMRHTLENYHSFCSKIFLCQIIFLLESKKIYSVNLHYKQSLFMFDTVHLNRDSLGQPTSISGEQRTDIYKCSQKTKVSKSDYETFFQN